MEANGAVPRVAGPLGGLVRPGSDPEKGGILGENKPVRLDQALEESGNPAGVEVTRRLDRAVTRLNLGEVLKADQTTARSVERSSRAFEKYAIRGQTKVLKDLDKLTANPEHALTVRTAVAQAVADVQSAHNALRTDVADMVNEAIDGIQEILDDLLAEDVGAGE